MFLSVLGVGTGNLKDATMEMLADRGNGHYAYLDSLQEARRVLVREADATLENVAKDVKFQVEFNPALVSAWKLIGYENRAAGRPGLQRRPKDGGEMGAGHTVTVLYEIVPVGVERPQDRDGRPEVDPLRYQTPAAAPRVVQERPVVTDTSAGEWLTVKARYKQPEGETSQLITRAVRNGGRVRHLPLASAVAEFGLLLRAAPAARRGGTTSLRASAGCSRKGPRRQRSQVSSSSWKSRRGFAGDRVRSWGSGFTGSGFTG